MMMLTVAISILAAQEPSGLPTAAEGWTLELVARSPQIRHPSVVCCAPDGRVFVGEDPIDMEGPLDQPVDRIECIHPDGRMTLFADHLGPVFGMMYLDGRLYVQHVPRWSVFRDASGDVGRDRVDLIESTNPTPSAGNGLNDHIPANFHLAMDGYLYVAVGQKGIYNALGTDGKRFEMREGGILRMKPDASALEVYARGVRNIMDVAMTSEDELFAYDNDDHTKTWKVKLLHMVDGGYYGFPWDFKPAKPYTLGGFLEFPGGAPTGGLAYTEDALPAEDRDALFLCDWGRRTVFRVRLERQGATYRARSVDDIIPPGPNDFRPVGITVSPDGRSFYVTDWNFPGWKQKKDAGRLFKLTWKGPDHSAPKPSWYLAAALGRPTEAGLGELVAGLGHPARSVRDVAQRRISERGAAAREPLAALAADPSQPLLAREHAMWALGSVDGALAVRTALRMATGDPALRAQAIRLLGTRAGKEATGPLSLLLRDPGPEIRFRAATALGRIADPAAVPALEAVLEDPDSRVRFCAFTALHRIGRAEPRAWESIARGLAGDRELVREGVLFALRETYEEPVVHALATFVGDAGQPGPARAVALGVLADLELKPAPWDGRWWRNGPYAFAEDNPQVGPRIDKILPWPGTAAVRSAVRTALEDQAPEVRAAAALALAPRPVRATEGPAPAGTASARPVPSRVDPEPYAAFARKTTGDSARGRELFLDLKRTGCSRCHRVAGQGGDLGPDLAGVGSKYDRTFLIESVLYPSKQIAEGFAQSLIQLRDGRVLSGLVRAETSEEVALVDGEGRRTVVRTSEIERRKASEVSLMPENLESGLSPAEFADLIAYLSSLQDAGSPVSLFNGKDLTGWKKDPANEGHWTPTKDGTLWYDGQGHDLWTEKSYGDFVLSVDWRFPPVEAGGKPAVEKEAPVILPDGSVSGRTQKVLDAGDSGIFLRGTPKCQANIWCWPIGSGEIYGFRTDGSLPPEVRAAATPRLRADRPVGEWNHFEITIRGERITILLNGKAVIDDARLPGVPARGPIGIQHPGKPLTVDMPVEFRNLSLRELP